jgi:D-arabinose 1-dehydrogenase-like Zn-dependent alcohol dehydrogenase
MAETTKGIGKGLRVGVVGVGVMGSNHARVYADLAGVELVGIADPDRLTERARQLGLPLRLIPFAPKAAPRAQQAGALRILATPLPQAAVAGQLNPANSR